MALIQLPDPFLVFHVPGKPAPQGSKRYLGPGRAIESSKHLPAWRADVRAAAAVAVRHDPVAAPVGVELTFVMARPKSHHRTGRNSHILRDGAPAFPAGKPDVDKLARAVLDALTTIVYADDQQVVQLIATKIYGGPGITLPGCKVHVWEAL